MQPHRSSALGYASAASAVHSRVYRACTAEAAASEALGLSVGGCPGARRYFGPYPVGCDGAQDRSAGFCMYSVGRGGAGYCRTRGGAGDRSAGIGRGAHSGQQTCRLARLVVI